MVSVTVSKTADEGSNPSTCAKIKEFIDILEIKIKRMGMVQR